MKVVLFCGGLGTRLRDYSETTPKPLVNIGIRPIVWHLMRYYAHYGHTDFILCLGYQGHMIREYFLNYNEALSNDFTLSLGGKRIDLHGSDIDGWRITFVDTGLNSTVAERLMKVRGYLGDDELFLANYSDGLSNLPLDRQIADFRSRAALASFASVRSAQTFHAVHAGADGVVTRIGALHKEEMRINGGFFVFRRGLLDYLREGEELMDDVFPRLIAERKLTTFRWDGFWQCMDTFKDKIGFDAMEAQQHCPWKVWQQPARPQGRMKLVKSAEEKRGNGRERKIAAA